MWNFGDFWVSEMSSSLLVRLADSWSTTLDFIYNFLLLFHLWLHYWQYFYSLDFIDGHFLQKNPLRKQRAADAGPTSDTRNGEEISNVTFKQTMVTFTLSHVMNLRHVGAICCLKKKSTWEAFKSNVNPASSSQWDYVRWWCVVLDAGRQFMFVDSSCKLTSATVALC